MKILKNAKVEKAVATETARYVMNDCWLSVEDKRLVATDGRIMVAFPIEPEEGDESGPMSVKALQAARKAAPKKATHFSLKANGHYILPDGGTMPRDKTHNRFLDWKAIIPTNTAKAGKETLSINAAYLEKIQEAIAADYVTLEFIQGAHCIKVKGGGNEPETGEAIALIMPCE